MTVIVRFVDNWDFSGSQRSGQSVRRLSDANVVAGRDVGEKP